MPPTDTLYHTNLPNVRGEPGHYGSQRVCLRYRPEMLEGVALAEAVPALIEFFWSTGFNQDIANSAFGRAQARDPRFASLEAWEAASRENPLFPLEVDWEPANRDLPGLWLECLKLHGETADPIEPPANWRTSSTGCRWDTEAGRRAGLKGFPAPPGVVGARSPRSRGCQASCRSGWGPIGPVRDGLRL